MAATQREIEKDQLGVGRQFLNNWHWGIIKERAVYSFRVGAIKTRSREEELGEAENWHER